MTHEEATARESIRQTITSYTIAGDARDPKLFNDLWAADALFEFDGWPPLPGFRCNGIVEIHARSASWVPLSVAARDPAMHGTSFVRHNLTSCHIELTSSDTAKALTYFIVMTDIGPDHSGTYTDKLVLQGDRWLFAHRKIALDWRSPDSCFPPVPKEGVGN